MEKNVTLFDETKAEFLGTLILVFFGVGVVWGLNIFGSGLSQWAISISWGLGVALAIYVVHGVSGAHINPAVTITLSIWRDFEKRKVVPYIISQMLGAFAGAALVFALYHNFADVSLIEQASWGYTSPVVGLSTGGAFLVEMVVTMILVIAILAITDDRNGGEIGKMGPLLIGIVVAVIGVSFGYLTGFAMNPARDFGPRLFAFVAGYGTEMFTYTATVGLSIPYFIIPLIAPIIGAIIAPLVYDFFVGKAL